jgi:hypothetical protein
MRSYLFILDHWSGQVLDMKQPVDAFASAGLLYIFMLLASSPIVFIYYLFDPLVWRSVSIWFIFNTLVSKEYLIWREFSYSNDERIGTSIFLFMKLMSLMIFIMIFVAGLVMFSSNKLNIYILIAIVTFSTMYITTGKAVKLYRSA